MGSVVGVSIGTDAIRAAELALGRRPAVRACTTVATRPGSVHLGEPVDDEAVAETIRAAWSTGRFRSKDMIAVLDGRQTVMRLVDLPEMPEPDLRRAAALDIEEVLSYPVDEALVNVLPVDTHDEQGRRHHRYLVVGVRVDTVERLRAIARAAGVRLRSVDVAPLALTRALEPAPQPKGGSPVAELIVDVGTEVTHLVVRVGDRTRFVRVLTSTVDDENALLASELEMQLSTIASFRGESAAEESMSLHHPVIVGIRSTIEYYQSLPACPLIAGAVVTGIGPNCESTAASLASLFGLHVVQGEPLGWDAGLGAPTGFDSAVGAALSALRTAQALDLRTDEDRARERRRRQTLVGAGVAGVIGIALGVDALGRHGAADDLAAEAARLEATAAQAQLEVAAADDGSLAGLTAGAERAIGQLTAALASDIDVVAVVDQIAASLPWHTYLTAISLGSDAGPSGEGATAGASLTDVQVTGDAPDYAGLADWLTGVGDLPILDGGWVGNSATDGGEGSGGRTTFSASASVVVDPGPSRLPRYLLSVDDRGGDLPDGSDAG
jgi:type IV pilus assembly protein PilM